MADFSLEDLFKKHRRYFPENSTRVWSDCDLVKEHPGYICSVLDGVDLIIDSVLFENATFLSNYILPSEEVFTSSETSFIVVGEIHVGWHIYRGLNGFFVICQILGYPEVAEKVQLVDDLVSSVFPMRYSIFTTIYPDKPMYDGVIGEQVVDFG